MLCEKWGGKRGGSRTNPRLPQVTDTIELAITSPVRDEVFLRAKYVDEGLSPAQIAAQAGVSKSCVLDHLKRHGLLTGKHRRPGYLLGQTPFGWKREKGKLVPHVSEQKVIARMIEARRDGKSLHWIARMLTDEKIETKNGGRWHAKSISQILECNTRLLKQYES